MYKGYRSRKKNRKNLDKDIQNEIEKNIIMSNISNRSKLENRINKVNYTKNTNIDDIEKQYKEEYDLSKDSMNPEIKIFLNKEDSIQLEKNDILEDIDKILMSRNINEEIDNYHNKYNEELYVDLDNDESKLNEDTSSEIDFSFGKIDFPHGKITNIECIKKDKDLICYGLLNKTELNELNNYLQETHKSILEKSLINKDLVFNKNILFSEKEDNLLSKELTLNPNIYMEMIGECNIDKKKDVSSINSSTIKKDKSYYDRVIDNLYKLFI
jgi:hypothetical protein